MQFEHTEVFNIEGALRGMRNPLNSWAKSDSEWEFVEDPSIINPNDEVKFVIGENDMKLAQRLILAGSEHRKFMRQIFVSTNVTAPLYFFKQFDTYHVGVTTNSTSTMHKLASTPITMECFELGNQKLPLYPEAWDNLIKQLETLRLMYNKTKDKAYWYELIRMLPESWLQTRTVTMSYENIRNMYFQRRNHKLTEWSKSFIEWVDSLPYANELIKLEA